MSIGSYEQEIDRAREQKEQSLQDPNGVLYMDQLWDLLKDREDPLTVELRTDEVVYDDTKVPAYWSYDRSTIKSDAEKRSRLVFGLPPKVASSIQSAHAKKSMHRFFGQSGLVMLDEPITGDDYHPFIGRMRHWDEQVDEVINGDWGKLRTAIEVTAQDSASYLGGQRVKIMTPTGPQVVRARVNEAPLEESLQLYLDKGIVIGINRLWAQAFRREVLLEDS